MVLINGSDSDPYPQRDYSSLLSEPSGCRRDVELILPMLRVQPFELPTCPAAFVYQRREDQPQPAPLRWGGSLVRPRSGRASALVDGLEPLHLAAQPARIR
jgi:hypothetical protein